MPAIRSVRFVVARAAVAAAAMACFVPTAGAAVRINEIVAAPSARLLRTMTNGAIRLGMGASWMDRAFDASPWRTGPGPFGFGTNYLTNLSGELAGPMMSVYLRSPFVVASSNATSTNAISLTLNYDSGFVAYLNDREVLRRNLGPAGAFAFRDQTAFNLHRAGTNETWTLGTASNLLVTGTNVFAIQVHSFANASFAAGPDLGMIGPTGRVALAGLAGPWQYFVGAREPSGGIPDGSSPPASVRGREWTLLGFLDDGWSAGPGGIGYGDNDDATNVSNRMYGVCAAVYLRRTFVVPEATAGLTNGIEFIVDYDDGYVAYLNGSEISRAGLGAVGSFVPHTLLASGREAGVPVTTVVGAANVWLRPGTNVLAIQVHNSSLTSSDLSMIADLKVQGGDWLVRHEETWRYFVGVESPVATGDEDEADEDAVLFDPDFADWVELYNDGATPVALGGWSLTDDAGNPGRWRFPATATIAPRQYLLVLCTGRDIRDASAPVWHTNFKLESGGEYLGLYNGAGAVVSQLAPAFPRQSAFHSYGWSDALSAWRNFETPTPAATNVGTSYTGMCAMPDFGTPAGFSTSSISVAISCTTPGAAIRFTIDGSAPTETTGFAYAGGIPLSTTASVRARAFLSGWVPSPTATRSFLVNPTNLLRGVPSLLLTGPWSETFGMSNGVTSIQGGFYTNGIYLTNIVTVSNSVPVTNNVPRTNAAIRDTWISTNANDYNIPKKRGRPTERPVSVEFAFPSNNVVKQTDAGLRLAGSDYTRPRYILQQMASNWYGFAHVNKAQFNLFFRSAYGDEPFDFKLVPWILPKTPYESLRLRGGKNDWDRPFIKDELMRRLYGDTGQPASRGLMAALYVNSIFRCYYNPTEPAIPKTGGRGRGQDWLGTN